VNIPPFRWWWTVLVLVPSIAVYTIVMGTLSLVGGLFDGSGTWAHKCAQTWARLILLTSGVTIRTLGRPLPPERESCIFVANHSSIYDVPILFTALPRQLRIMAKAALGYVPFIGWHLRRSGHLLVNRKNPGAGIFKRMQRMAKSGASLVVFPEASRTMDGSVHRFKGGIFLLAIENGLPVVPVSVSGSRIVMPKGRFMVCPATVDVTVHDAIPTKGMTREDARALAERVRSIVASAIPGGNPDADHAS
jgi:1-acyl-sn-glycerol-3-phosphate acyltransferase